MFMWFRGGGIGHKVTWEWDELLQRKGCDPPLDDEDIVDDLESKDHDLADKLEEEIGIGEGDGIGKERDGVIHFESDKREDEEDNVIVADEGEELDKEIYDMVTGMGTFAFHTICKKAISYIIRMWTTTSVL